MKIYCWESEDEPNFLSYKKEESILKSKISEQGKIIKLLN
jgi:hypothetical protein